MDSRTPMPHDSLRFLDRPQLTEATLLLALSGWMDGGLVSTGTVRRLRDEHAVRKIAEIDSEGFYIYNIPGSMEIAALFRPNCKYEQGIVTELEFPENAFYCAQEANVVFFEGKEPNLNWHLFADCLFDLAAAVGIRRIIFIGSFGGSVPHTREPRLYGSVSHPRLKRLLRQYNIRPSEYEGPASFATLLLKEAPRRDIEMLSLAAEIPGYLQGINPLSIEAVTRRLGAMLEWPVDLDKLRHASNAWEIQVSEAVEKDEKLAATIRKLEEEYDNELLAEENNG